MKRDVIGYLWVDALCIDQTNIQERASQVSLMGDIYSTADRVIIWLGNTISNHLSDLIWLQEHWLPIADRFPKEELPLDVLAFLDIPKERWFVLWENYGKFYSYYRWFSRAWVVQELLLAREIVIRCGSITLDWEMLKKLADTAVDAGVPTISSAPGEFIRLLGMRKSIINGEPTHGLWSYNSGCRTIREGWYAWLMQLTDVVRNQNASCDHDKIYAVFGIAQKSLPRGSETDPITACLAVNYEQSTEDAYSLFAAELLMRIPTLALLSYVTPRIPDTGSKLRSLPSWCPEFTSERRGVPLFLVSDRDGDYTVPVFAASKSLGRPNGLCSITGRVLYVSGKRVACVTKPGLVIDPILDTERLQKSPGCEGFFDSCRELDPIYELTGQDRVEVLWRTLMLDNESLAGLDLAGSPNAETYSLAFSYYVCVHSSYAVIRMSQEEADDFMDLIAKRFDDFEGSSITLPNPRSIVECATLLQEDPFHPLVDNVKNIGNMFGLRARQHTGKRLFTTAQKWLGLGPFNLEEGDEVWLLKSAKVPFILRPYGASQYRLIGEAYVHGIMQGQLIDAPGGRDGFREIEIV